jgi:LemA protein
MRTEWIIFAAIAAICVAAVVIFNRLISGRNQVREGWSGIDVQLRRRADLIPNLVEAVRAYAAHERGVIDDVTAQRSSIIVAGDLGAKAKADHELQGSLKSSRAREAAAPDRTFNASPARILAVAPCNSMPPARPAPAASGRVPAPAP